MANENPQGNPYRRGVFVELSGEEAQTPRRGLIHIGGTPFDMSPYINATLAMGSYVREMGADPYNPMPLLKAQRLAANIRPGVLSAMNHPNPAIRQFVAPMAHGMQTFLKNANALIGMRLRTSHHLARSPKIIVPISMSIVAGATLAGVQVRNPYLGASGGATGTFQSPWMITSFRTSNGESGALLPIRLTQFLVGGHDFVAAGLTGLTYSAGGAPATQGWAAGAFTETKRGNWKTEVQPWNVVAVHGGGTGFGSVMTETGFLQIGVFNGGAQTYVDTYSVYCNATLCGSPFGVAQWTQLDAFRKSFAPLNAQTEMAVKLAGASDGWLQGAGLATDDPSAPPGPYRALEQLLQMQGDVRRVVDSPPDGIAMGEDFVDARSYGVGLPDGAAYVD